MQRYPPVDDEVVLVFGHSRVHLLVHETESKGFIAHQRLVVRLSIGYGFHILQTVCHGEEELMHVPLLVRLILQHFYPEIGQAHAEAVVEAYSAVLDLSADSRHPAYIFSYCNIMIINIMRQFISQLQICHSIIINIIAEIFPRIVESLADAMVFIKHRSHAIEAVAVEMIFLEPESHVREKQLQRLGLAIVKQLRIPLRMDTFLSGFKILIFSAIEEIDTFADIFHGMRMNKVHYHQQTHAMCRIHKLFQLFGRTETRTGGEKVRHMIAKRAVVRMLGDCHELHSVVTICLYAR